jgi:hypothetical protein
MESQNPGPSIIVPGLKTLTYSNGKPVMTLAESDLPQIAGLSDTYPCFEGEIHPVDKDENGKEILYTVKNGVWTLVDAALEAELKAKNTCAICSGPKSRSYNSPICIGCWENLALEALLKDPKTSEDSNKGL